ncbi:hypothetical protein ACFUMJ_17575 [Streptomyces olivaceus]|uniref:hypothetical protein n=1 Tax=Streptomyces TaxID=1883 RepID=UPI001FB7314B|nr:hypothetical protein [Streptomyces sp. CB09030]UOG79103.1 hypothetical protein L6J92_07765 [Streptomyces sp. CB09030]
MTAATYRRISLRNPALRWAWAVVVTLLAAFAVLVHHDTVVTASPISAMSAMPEMDHAAVATMQGITQIGDHEAEAVGPALGHDGGGACSGPAMQHCSSGNVATPQLLSPPAALSRAAHGFPVPGLAAQALSAISHRAPPDLSVLSRLLI